MPPMVMLHEKDPKDELANAVGDVSGVELFNNQILVAIYMRPKKTKSGIYLADQTTDEDKYQSKVGLLIKKGPKAFDDPDGDWFDGAEQFQLNDWLVYRPSDGWSIAVNGVPCRVLVDTQVKGRVDQPDRVW